MASSSFSHNKSSKPFGATAKRELGMSIFGAEAPGPGAYEPKKAVASSPEGRHIFRSGSSQRPGNKTAVPGAGTYSPNMKAVHANMRDSGASMRGAGIRFAEEQSMTEEAIGPGAYDQVTGTLAVDAKKSVDKGSKIRPAFGATTKQRPPAAINSNPAPGSYQPLSPRRPKKRVSSAKKSR